MKKEEIVKSLLDFADHMCAVEDEFKKMRENSDEVLSKSAAANSIWKDILSFISKIFFVLTGLSIWITVLAKIKGMSLNNLSGAELFVKNICCPFPMAFIAFFGMACLFTFFSFREQKSLLKAEKEFFVARSKINAAFEEIKEKYSEYENPPVPLEFSNPYFVLDMVEIIENSEEDISITEAISMLRKKDNF